MTPSEHLDTLLARPEPLLALAPMQDVTDLPFWRLLARYGGPDVYWTEYFRVTATWRPEKWILRSIVENPTGRPCIAQLIGSDPEAMARAARELQHYPVAAIDLNLGCPAPVVYRKCAGGGLLREPARVDLLLGRLRDAVGQRGIKFTVKTRLGFDSPRVFDELLPIFADPAESRAPADADLMVEAYTSYLARITQFNAPLALTDLPSHPNPEFDDSGLTLRSRQLTEGLQGSQFRDSWERQQINTGLTLAAFAILKGQPVPNDPVHGQPYTWNPDTRELSMPNGPQFSRLGKTRIKLPKL